MWVQFLNARPLKFGKAKNVQILARFLTTFDFDREYLRNGSRHQKFETSMINSNPFHVGKRNLVNFGPHTKTL